MAEYSAQSSRLRSFWSLWVTQFQGAFSDNTFKMLVMFFILGVALSSDQEDRLILWVGILFSIPFILFSMTGGWLANRFSKRHVTTALKVSEIIIMILATVGLARGDVRWLLVCVFLMSLQSALFGPSKYGLLPELLSEESLSWGNGILQMGTNVAIMLGTVVAGLLADQFSEQNYWSGVILIALACIGTASSLGIARIPAANPTAKFRFNLLGDLFDQVQYMRLDRVLTLAIAGNMYFSLLGSFLILNVMMYGKVVLGLTFMQTSLLQTAVAVGIGGGAVAAGYLSGRKIEYGLVPLGSIGLTVACALLGKPGLNAIELSLLLVLAGFFGGFYIVPLGAILQYRPDKTKKAGVLAAYNMLSFVGVVAGSGLYFLVRNQLGFDPSQVFLIGSVMTLAGTVYAVILLPDALLRLLVWLFTHSVYRIRVEGRENIPEKGGALFVCNHVSFVDALLLIASTDRMLRAVMFKDIYDHPIIKPFARIMKAIPISSQQRPREMIRSLKAASERIKQGEVVVIFAEGQITRIGQLLPFRRGMEMIMKGVDAPIIPVCLDGVWGSIFSFDRGRFFGKIPRQIPYPVTVSYGKPMPSTSTPFEVRQEVQALNSKAWHHRRKMMRPISRRFVQTARRHPFLFAMADSNLPKVNFISVLMKTIFLARRLRNSWKHQKMVGILLPPSVPGALVNYAALLMGKIPVNLNYTVSADTIKSCIDQCKIETVVTSKIFLERMKIELPCPTIIMEELSAHPKLSEKLIAVTMAWLFPAGLLEKALGRKERIQLDDTATVIFSSGSTGEPKGVVLSHYNIGSNVDQAGQTLAFSHQDRILGILPFFHSFGFTVTLTLPALMGVGVIFHANPLDTKAVGEIVHKYRMTFLMCTPTFLQMYMRGCTPEQFGSLEFVVTGAEKLPTRLAQAFEDQFGIRPLEGYGCTECAPVVSVNTRDFRAPGFRQVGAKRGKIGHPLPGVSVKVVDPDSFETLSVGQPGLLLVCGPNIMKEYLNQPEKTAEVIRDGWYVTGDIAALDEDGFIQITDRLSRFSKIGGEMVPHIKIEEKLHEAADAHEQTFAVTSIPDDKKGERLAVLYTLTEEKLTDCLERFAKTDLPNLWRPRREQFFHVDSLPYLGTGKLDLRKIREVALASSNANP